MDEKEKMKRNLYRRLLICFFACMVFFTILSRVIDVYETAKVSIAYAKLWMGTAVWRREKRRQFP